MTLILPGNPLFDLTLATAPPPGSHPGGVFVVGSEDGIMRPATPEELNEYIHGGEYDARLKSIGDDALIEKGEWLGD